MRGAECGLVVTDAAVTNAWQNLTDRGFLDGASLKIFMSSHGMGAKHTTELGDRLLAFVDK